MKRHGPPDLRDLEREILAAAERARVDAQDLADRLRGDAQAAAERLRTDAQAAGERVRQEAKVVGEKVRGEAPRKTLHLASIIIPLGILYFPLSASRRTLMVVGVALLVADLVKIHEPRWRSIFTKFFGPLIRRHEHTGITSSTYMIVSALLATYLFDRPVAAAALVFLIVGDTMAAIIGLAWGRTRLFGKSLEGFLAGLVASFVAGALLVPEIPLPVLALGALAGAIIEVLPLPVDDNFRIPLVAGLVLQFAR